MIRLILPGQLRAWRASAARLNFGSKAKRRNAQYSTHSRHSIPYCAAHSATMSQNAVVHTCGSSPAKKISRTSPQMPRCPIQSPRERSPSLW